MQDNIIPVIRRQLAQTFENAIGQKANFFNFGKIALLIVYKYDIMFEVYFIYLEVLKIYTF